MKRAFEQGADYVWLLNNDTLVPRDALSELVRGMEAAEAGLASPLIYFREPAERLQFCGSVIDWKNRQIRHLEQLKDLTHAAAGESLSLWGTALLVKRKVVDDVGYLCEKYFAYHEDEEYSLRANRAGYRCVVVPEARVYHKNSRSTGHNDAPVQVFLRSRNQYFLWMDGLKWKDRIFHVPKYLSRIISYGGSLNDKNLPESLEACLDGMWCGFRGIGGPRRRDIAMPAPLRSLFRFLFSWHPYFWSNLFRGDFGGIRADIVKRLRTGKTSA
jgi:GT2 family glycosyltransferase